MKMEEETVVKREVKNESEDDSNDGVSADVFGVTVKSENVDEDFLVKPELLAEVRKSNVTLGIVHKLWKGTG